MAAAENTGYPTGWFKLQDIAFARKLYECAICLEVVKDAMQVRDCGHLFCRCCIERVLKLQAPLCPTCRNEISEEMIFPDKNANRAIGNLEVNCPSTGCEWDGTLNSLLQEHNARCPFFVLNCNNCDVQVIRQELEVHLTKCEHRTVVCEHCKMEHVFKDKDEHLSMCHLLPVECENKCSEKNIPRNEMKEHLDTVCSQTVIKCKYSEFGCEYECKRQEMEEHLNQATKEHLELHTLQISGLKKKHENDMKQLQSKLEIDKNEIKEWKTKHENDMKQLQSKHENDMKQLQSKHENDMKQLQSKHEIDKNEMKEWKTKHENDVKQLTSKHERDIRGLKAKHYEQINEINQMLRSNCSGTYTMKICDIEDRLRQAKLYGFENHIYGEPFFTSCYGYKMRLHITLDEKEHGFTGYMGAYLCLLSSDHDDTLQWPFNKVYTFSVIDQQRGSGRNDHVMTVVPEGEDAYERPQQDEERGCGFKSFISHSNLDDCNYIKNDVVYIKVQMES